MHLSISDVEREKCKSFTFAFPSRACLPCLPLVNLYYTCLPLCTKNPWVHQMANREFFVRATWRHRVPRYSRWMFAPIHHGVPSSFNFLIKRKSGQYTPSNPIAIVTLNLFFVQHWLFVEFVSQYCCVQPYYDALLYSFVGIYMFKVLFMVIE